MFDASTLKNPLDDEKHFAIFDVSKLKMIFRT